MNSTENQEARQGSGEMFDQIAERYDLLNRLMSLGIDRGWRERTVGKMQEVASAGSPRLLDVATGTGDLALAMAKAYPLATVVGLDPSKGMLSVAEQKRQKASGDERVSFQVGSAEALPFEDGSFDGV